MKPEPNPLTPEQIESFDGFVRKWQETLGLQDWRIVRGRKKTRHMADVECDHPARMAVYRTGDFGAEPTSPERIESIALHEVLHVFLAELVHQGEYGIEGLVLDAAEHRVVHVLEKLLMRNP